MFGMAAIGRIVGRALAAGAMAALVVAPVTANATVLAALPAPLPLHNHASLPVLAPSPSQAPGTGRQPSLSQVQVPAFTSVAVPAPPVLPPPPPRPTSKLVDGVPFLWQIYALSCESAALQMAVSHEGVQASQDQILDLIGSDLRGAYWDNRGLRWGDPYSTFVGYVGGSEDYLTGYGTYFPPIVKAAQQLNARVLKAGEGISPDELYGYILDGHPAVLWISYEYGFHERQDYTTFEGRQVLYAGPFEHAVTGAGVNEGSILINDPLSGQFWVDKATFEATFRTYNQMAVIID